MSSAISFRSTSLENKQLQSHTETPARNPATEGSACQLSTGAP